MFVQSFAKGPVTQRKRMNYARITHILSFLRGVLNGSKNFRCVIYESAGVVYVSSMRDYARDTRRPSVLMRRNWRTFTSVHWRPTFISRMNRAHITFIAKRMCLYVERTRSLHVWTRSVSDSCVWRASNVREIMHRICSYASTCAIFQWFVSDWKWYRRRSCVIHAWLVSDFYPQHPETLVNFSTQKRAQTQYVRHLWVIRA